MPQERLLRRPAGPPPCGRLSDPQGCVGQDVLDLPGVPPVPAHRGRGDPADDTEQVVRVVPDTSLLWTAVVWSVRSGFGPGLSDGRVWPSDGPAVADDSVGAHEAARWRAAPACVLGCSPGAWGVPSMAWPTTGTPQTHLLGAPTFTRSLSGYTGASHPGSLYPGRGAITPSNADRQDRLHHRAVIFLPDGCSTCTPAPRGTERTRTVHHGWSAPHRRARGMAP